MIVKTKKYQLTSRTYTKIGMRKILKAQWWLPVSIFFGIIALNLLLNLVYTNTWVYIFAPIGVGLYFLFWWIQFVGATQLEQSKPMFQKFNYEIDGKQILMKLNSREGMQIKWEMIKLAEKRKDAFVLFFSNVQFLHLPFRIFNSENEIRFLETLLKRKNLLK